MIKIEGKSYDFGNLPVLEEMYGRYESTDKIKFMLRRLEEIRYVMYAMSYCHNGCDAVHEIDYQLNRQYAQFPALGKAGLASELFGFVDEIHDRVERECGEIFEARAKELAEALERDDLEDMSGEELFKDLIANRELSWDFISNMFYNEVENPSVVNWVLEKIFGGSSRAGKTARRVSLYDFSDYSVEVLGEEEATLIVGLFDTGTVFNRDGDGGWTAAYDFS